MDPIKKKTQLEHEALPRFEPQLKALLVLAFDGGIRALEAAGFKLGDDLTDDRARELYRNGLFSSFAKAQSEVGAAVIELEQRRRDLIRKLKILRAGGDPNEEDVEAELGATTNRLIVLRRLIDSILFITCPDHSVLKLLAKDRAVRNPEPDELKRVLAIADDLNRSHSRELHLVSDLTSVVQLGDIVRIRWDDEGVYVRLHEIKSGRMNDDLGELLDARGGHLSDADLDDIAAKLGPRAREQAERMVRQREAFATFAKRAGSDMVESEDPDLRRLAGTKPPALETYLHLLPEVVADAATHGVAFHCIDDCLWLVGVSETGLEQLGEVRNLQHRLFHAKNPEEPCAVTEIEQLNREAPLVNLAAHNLVRGFSRPPLAWYPKELVLDVVMDRVRIYVQFDLIRFFQIAASAGLCLRFITGREAERGKKARISEPMLENPKAYGVEIKFSDGRTTKLRSSLFRSVYSELIRPRAILRTLFALRDALGRRP